MADTPDSALPMIPEAPDLPFGLSWETVQVPTKYGSLKVHNTTSPDGRTIQVACYSWAESGWEFPEVYATISAHKEYIQKMEEQGITVDNVWTIVEMAPNFKYPRIWASMPRDIGSTWIFTEFLTGKGKSEKMSIVLKKSGKGSDSAGSIIQGILVDLFKSWFRNPKRWFQFRGSSEEAMAEYLKELHGEELVDSWD